MRFTRLAQVCGTLSTHHISSCFIKGFDPMKQELFIGFQNVTVPRIVLVSTSPLWRAHDANVCMPSEPRESGSVCDFLFAAPYQARLYIRMTRVEYEVWKLDAK
jgi:hypothetical protein